MMTHKTDIDLVLVDFDDTLVDTAPRFARARLSLFERLERAGFDRALIERVHHHEVDPIMRRDHGFGPQRMPLAFMETYAALCRQAAMEPEAALRAECEALGSGVAGTPPPLEGALEALARLAAALPTVVYTQSGDPEYQLRCLREAGALDAVGEARVRVVASKTAEALRSTLEEFGVSDPARAWMVGNSIRSDINPALELGVRALLVETLEPWQHDVMEPLHNGFPIVPTFREAVSLLLDDHPS